MPQLVVDGTYGWIDLFATETVTPERVQGDYVLLDVTKLVRNWLSQPLQNWGIVLKLQEGAELGDGLFPDLAYVENGKVRTRVNSSAVSRVVLDS